MIDISGHRKGNTMTKEYVFGLIWLPIAIGLLVIFPNWWTFSILLIGILIFVGGELQEKETIVENKPTYGPYAIQIKNIKV